MRYCNILLLSLHCTCLFIGSATARNAGGSSATPIKHIVVLMEENRAFDHIFGWASLNGGVSVNGLSGDEFNLVDVNDPSSEKVYVTANCPYMNDCDPSHGTSATTSKIFSGQTEAGTANMGGFASYESSHASSNYCNVMDGFAPEDLPVINSLAEEFAVMDRFFASHPGPTWPNRMFMLSATSAGSTETFAWYQNINGQLFPQRTIFDQIEVAGMTWKNYYNDTPWELFMAKIANSPDNLSPMEQFYRDCETGSLPSFSWINPRSGINTTTGVGSNDQHPDHDMRAGEQFYKDIYEALRSSPSWNETLFIITYDEHGGFYDHVVPPSVDVPAPGDGEHSYPGDFNFQRLGMRIPTLLISPWIKRRTVLSAPPAVSKPFPSSEYDLTSIMATARLLLGMPTTPLTNRDAWAATFESAFDFTMEEPRTDCPAHLPDAIPPDSPSDELTMPLNELQKDIAHVHAHLTGVGAPNHATQAFHSDWVSRQYQLHSKQVLHYQTFADNDFKVVTQPEPLFRDNIDDDCWDMNGLKYGGNPAYENSTAPFITVSTMHLRVELPGAVAGVALCLDVGSGVAGSVLGVKPCLPSPDPLYNRVKSQHFLFPGDGTLRLYQDIDDKPLCVTNNNPNMNAEDSTGTLVTTLQQCNGSVEQSWAYHGSAPGRSMQGELFYGDWANALGVLNVAVK